jgi:hypothetical protein
VAHKQHIKTAVPLPEGGFKWAWDGAEGVRHEVTWLKNGQTFWEIFLDGTLLRSEQPWFLVKVRGEVQENIKHFRANDLDTVTANRALISAGIAPNQHTARSWCICANCHDYDTGAA